MYMKKRDLKKGLAEAREIIEKFKQFSSEMDSFRDRVKARYWREWDGKKATIGEDDLDYILILAWHDMHSHGLNKSE
jgi:hypothetical protein